MNEIAFERAGSKEKSCELENRILIRFIAVSNIDDKRNFVETILFPSDNDFWKIFCWKKVYMRKNVAFFSTNRKMFNVFGKTLIYLPLIKKKQKFIKYREI